MEGAMKISGFTSGFKILRDRNKKPSIDLSDLKSQDQELRARVEKLAQDVRNLTMNGEEKWFLCLTKRREACDDPNIT